MTAPESPAIARIRSAVVRTGEYSLSVLRSDLAAVLAERDALALRSSDLRAATEHLEDLTRATLDRIEGKQRA